MGNNEFHDYIGMSIPVQIILTPVEYLYPYENILIVAGKEKIMMSYVRHSRSCDQIMGVGFTLIGLFPNIDIIK